VQRPTAAVSIKLARLLGEDLRGPPVGQPAAAAQRADISSVGARGCPPVGAEYPAMLSLKAAANHPAG